MLAFTINFTISDSTIYFMGAITDQVITNSFTILPAFLGFYVIFLGLKELRDESNNFTQMLPFVLGLIVASVILSLFQWFVGGLDNVNQTLSLLCLLAMYILQKYVEFNIIKGIKEMERNYGVSMKGDNLQTYWTIDLVCYLLLILPGINFLAIIGMFVVSIIRLIAYYQSYKSFENVKENFSM